jgi:protein-L-isoaspartate(D-aspartate) O-methyltransferase
MTSLEWPQRIIEFTDWPTADLLVVDHLLPALTASPRGNELLRWSFVRKHPCWRIRHSPVGGRRVSPLDPVLDDLAASGLIRAWTAGIYEPESTAFGGTGGMNLAHQLFHRDSRCVLEHLAHLRTDRRRAPNLGVRELAILLPSVAMRAAGLDWYEQGDVWAKVAAQRPAEEITPASQRLIHAAIRLMTVDVSPASRPAISGRLVRLTAWINAFEEAGRELANLNSCGRLERGLRAVLAHHVIFHWNRLGLTYSIQSVLAALAKEIVMGTTDSPAGRPCAASVDAVNTDTLDTRATDLRNALVDHLTDQGRVRTERIGQAMRAVPRHLFVPDVPLDKAYANTTVDTKLGTDGAPISCASQPDVVAMMLEQLDVQPGDNVLELGAGTGYNAALLAYLVGENGRVTTIDVDEDIVDGARAGLAAAGVGNVTVVLGDGALGHPGNAPYQRIIATVGAHGVPHAWLDQLAPGGRLLVPLRLRGSVARSIAFERHDGAWRSVNSQMNTFMPLRQGIADDPRHTIPLTDDGTVTLITNAEQDANPDALVGVLQQPRCEVWTGVTFRGPESAEWLELWLTCALPNGLSRMPAHPRAVEGGLLTAPYPSSTAAFDKAALTYLTRRKAATTSADGNALYEFGVIGHGPGADALAHQVADAARTWDRNHRGHDVTFEIQYLNTDPPQSRPGRFSFDTTLNRIVIEWR